MSFLPSPAPRCLPRPVSAADSPREHLSLDANWKFHLGDDWPDALRLDKAARSSGPASERFSDLAWRSVNLPHDWAIELPFDRADGSHGFKPVGPGFPQNSIGWYRRTFDLPQGGCRQTNLARRSTACFAMRPSGSTAGSSSVTKAATSRSARTSRTWCISAGRTSIAVKVDATQVRGLVLRRRGHLPARVAGQDRAGGHRAGRDFCLQQISRTTCPKARRKFNVETVLMNSQTNAAVGDGELRNYCAGWQSRLGKFKAPRAMIRRL